MQAAAGPAVQAFLHSAVLLGPLQVTAVVSSHDLFLLGIIKNHVYNVEKADLVLPCSKTYRVDEKFVDTAENQPLKVRKPGAGEASTDNGKLDLVLIFCKF